MSGARRLVGSGEYDFDVVGESFYQPALGAICGGKTDESQQCKVLVWLVPEADNEHDPNAVGVYARDGAKLAHLCRADAARFRREMTGLGLRGEAAECDAMIVGGWSRGDRGEGDFGLKLDLEWPVRLDLAAASHRGGCLGAVSGLLAVGLMLGKSLSA